MPRVLDVNLFSIYKKRDRDGALRGVMNCT